MQQPKIAQQDKSESLPIDKIQDTQSIRQEEQFQSFIKLQKILKDEYLLLTTESEQKNIFEKKLHTTLFAYYRSTVNMGESTYQTIQNEKEKMERSTSFVGKIEKSERNEEKKYEQDKRLLEDEDFGNVYTFVKDLLLFLSKDPYLMMTIIKKNQHHQNISSFQSLAKVIVNSMYENIVDDDVFNKDLLKIVVFCLKTIIEDKKHFFQINLQEEGFAQLILTQIIERNDVKNYSKQLIKNTLLQIAKIDHIIQYKVNEEEDRMIKSVPKLQNKESTKSQQSPVKTNGYLNKNSDKRSKLKQYSQGFRIQDEKMRKGSIIKRKYKNCISDDLLRHLGINQQINFPCFSCGNSEQMKIEEEINKQLGIMLNRSEIRSESNNSQDISVLKNIVLIFFNDLFKMLYSMPAIIRISCKVLHRYLSERFNTKNCLAVVADFVINFWLSSALRIDVTMAQAAKLSPYLQKNVQQVITIIKGIVKDNYKDIHPSFAKQFNLLVSNLKVSIANYIHEVINIDSDKINSLCEEVQSNLKEKKEEKKNIMNIKSYCVCLNMNDIKKLLQLVKGAQKELAPLNDKIVKRVQKIEMMNDTNAFEDKKDKATGKLFRPSKAYVLFTELSLPEHLSIDYSKHYANAFKKNKSKNVLRQVLLSLDNLESYQDFYTANNLEDFICSLQINETDDALNSIDRIPLRLKLDYLQILSRNVKIGQVVKEMEKETMERFTGFRQTWAISKQCYLKAISSINFQNERLSIKQNYIRNEIKRRKLDEFFAKNEIKLCLTSPKTREKEIVLKTTLMKDVLEQYKQKLWLQNQSRCIHTALNLDFIKSLTGQPQKLKPKYESHINNIMKFSQILCSLPEVKERFNVIQDTIGIKDVFFDFIRFIRDFIKSKEQQYAILIENIEWLEENIELKISKRLYEKLYPKLALYDDIALYVRLKTLDWLTFEHLKIDEQLRNWKIWDVAACHLRLIDKLRTAAEKLHCIEETTRIIVNSYMLMSKSQKAATADDIYPLVILVLIRAAPKRLISSISFIQSFASQSKLLSKEGYCFFQLKAAIHFCDILNAENINLHPDEATNYIEFNKKIYEKEIEYGVYFMLSRRKDSPKSEKKKLDFLKDYFKKFEEK